MDRDAQKSRRTVRPMWLVVLAVEGVILSGLFVSIWHQQHVRSTGYLLERARSADGGERVDALRRLRGKTDEPKVLEAFLKAAEDSSAAAREVALGELRALDEAGREKHVAVFARAVLDDDPDVRLTAVSVLERMDPSAARAAAPELLKSLAVHDDIAAFVRKAIENLDLSAEQCVPHLAEAIRAPGQWSRLAAANLLQAYIPRSDEAYAVALKALRSPDESVAHSAWHGILERARARPEQVAAILRDLEALPDTEEVRALRRQLAGSGPVNTQPAPEHRSAPFVSARPPGAGDG